jgi:hypothetical protein
MKKFPVFLILWLFFYNSTALAGEADVAEVKVKNIGVKLHP